MLSILDKYICKTIFYNILATLFVLVSLSSIIKFVDQLRKIGQGTYTAPSALLYTILSIPKDIEVFFPMAGLLGAVIGLGALMQYKELIAMQASGFTRIRIVESVMKITIPLIFIMMVIGEFIAPLGEQIARNYRDSRLTHAELRPNYNEVWAIDNENFVFIKNIYSPNYIVGVNIYCFDKTRHLKIIKYAVSAKYNTNKKFWILEQVDEADLSNVTQVKHTHKLHQDWHTSLIPSKLQVLALSPETLSIRGLYSYAKYFQQTGQPSMRYTFSMWEKIFQPLSLVVMMLMAISFIFGPFQHAAMSIRVVMGVILGFVFYILNQIFGLLSLICHTPPILGALLPSIIFFTLSVIMLVMWKQ
ncbi:Lipopolysaccharide export system permease protein LptG [Candidatus Erwinia haradaeae]|uniref:Lipopolysaccharide export system permease protein LptG n=1 Tax=Candidatus Erwinia haradaeae TaxID=1922217 RepID=A0A451DLB6_9GAMM|nr:LPS export ABC transporter permease LptG [Candidatus Erwinia haradaeae]VFP87524.1 Lipopolysaccharide export system permease protein LptG [Candidatus Erwinia haradaeae]